MNQQELLRLALISILIGIGIGGLFLIILKLQRQNTVINSFIDFDNLVGLIGVVEIPFDQDSKGKVRVIFEGNTRYFKAVSHLTHQFEVGEKVLITEVQSNKIWVIPESELRNFNN
ncbi:NfeD family protein [Aphanothece sacrum]|uniref:(Dimethylallyl)adenosine tRNA methylthiotransferase n=1 Tax=Aphanothece sacrum FPU1 TaxID=1920663 RepID=A0A401IG90_APHSA|nr:NfeD family protein [Aphanothece sacrum]GBF80234.1 (dimethylallyl)adenosine tRNA methylthiotransferase [Aphanothece sacrum FPU1]